LADKREAGDHLMADLSDVETAILSCVSTAVYPDGMSMPALIGVVCRIYRGWPLPGSLNADLSAGTVNVTVFPNVAMGRTTTRFAAVWSSIQPVPTLSATVQGTSVIIGGTVDRGTAVGLCVDDATYVYRPRANDTLSVVAANIATQIQRHRIALLSGSSVSVPGAVKLIARVVTDGKASQEIRRQEREIRVIAWCPSPSLRDQTSSIIDTALAQQAFVDLADGTRARLSYNGTQIYDQSQNALLYRRDLIYMAEYPTISLVTAPGMLFGNLTIEADNLLI
jgi:hypothetical protein